MGGVTLDGEAGGRSGNGSVSGKNTGKGSSVDKPEMTVSSLEKKIKDKKKLAEELGDWRNYTDRYPERAGETGERSP